MHTKVAPTEPSTIQTHMIRVDLVDIGDQLVRTTSEDDGLIDLAADIAQHGLLQPIGVTPRPTGRYQLLWGKRRLRAHQQINHTMIRAEVRIVPDADVKTFAIIENIHRNPMTLQEEVDAVAYLHHDQHLPPDAIALRVSKGRGWVLRRLAIPNLPGDLRHALAAEAITLGAAETIALLTDDSARAYVLSQTVGQKLNLQQIRGLVEAFQAAPTITAAVEAGLAVARNTEPTTIYIGCATCLHPTPPTSLTTVRLCPDCVTIINSPEIQAALQPQPQPPHQTNDPDRN